VSAVNSEEPDFMALDAYIGGQFKKAAETYASGADIEARLRAVQESGKDTAHEEATTTD
jgi:hypothetical protein